MSRELTHLEGKLRDRLKDLLAITPQARQELINGGKEDRVKAYEAERDEHIAAIVETVRRQGRIVLAAQKPLDDLLTEVRAEQIRTAAQPYPSTLARA